MGGERGMTGVEVLAVLVVAGLLAAAVLAGQEKLDINRPPRATEMPVYIPAK